MAVDKSITSSSSSRGCNTSSISSSSSSSSISNIEQSLSIMKMQECTLYSRSNFYSTDKQQQTTTTIGEREAANNANNKPFYDQIMHSSWRRRIIEWMYSVIDHCNLRRDSVAVAAYYLDHSLEQDGMINSCTEFQLCAMTALHLAVKIYDSTVIKVNSMIKLGHGNFNEQDVYKMEVKLLSSLQWYLHPPTPICFLRQFFRLLPKSITPVTRYLIAELTRFISEISICFNSMICYNPSIIACSGIILAMEWIDEVVLTRDHRKDILHKLRTVGQIQLDSKEVTDVVDQLHDALSKNPLSLQELMNSIDTQCGRGGKHSGLIRNNRKQTKTTSDNYPKTKAKTTSTPTAGRSPGTEVPVRS